MKKLQDLVGLKVKLKTGEEGIITSAREGYIEYRAPNFFFDGIYAEIDFNGQKRTFDIFTAVVRRKFMTLENQEDFISLITPKTIDEQYSEKYNKTFIGMKYVEEN